MKHGAIVLLGILDQSCILLRIEILVHRDTTVPRHILSGATLQFDELIDHFILARGAYIETCGITVSLRILTKMLETRVALARTFGCPRVDLVKIREDCADRRVQAIEVETVEAHLCGALRQRVVVPTQPADEVEDVSVAPHPGGKALEISQRLYARRRTADATQVAIDAIGIRPVSFHGDGGKSFLGDQP